MAAVSNSDDWRAPAFRESVITKIEEAMRIAGGNPTSKNSGEMENHVFMKAKSKEEYLSFVARLILHVREMGQKPRGAGIAGSGGPGGQQGMPDPINALQNMARQGSTNQQQQMVNSMGMGNMPGPGVNQQGLMVNMGQMAGQMGGQMGGQMANQMANQMNPQVVNQQAQMQVLQNQLTHQQPGMQVNMQQQLAPGQVQNPRSMVGMPNMQVMQGKMPLQNTMAMGPQGMAGGQMMIGHMGPQVRGQVPVPNQMIVSQLGPGMGGQMGGQMPQMNSQLQQPRKQLMYGVPSPAMDYLNNGNYLGSPHASSRLGHQQIVGQQHFSPSASAYQQPDGMVMGPGPGGQFGGPGAIPRQGTPNPYLGQSPNPSGPPTGTSPAPSGMPGPGSVPSLAHSPAFAQSPSSQIVPSPAPPGSVSSGIPSQRQMGMAGAPSPGSSLNTPLQGGASVPTPSPRNSQEDQAYLDKVRQLSRYIEPLRRMIAKIGNEDTEKLSKMKKLFDILSNPNKRMPMETLLKCEVVLEKMDLKRGESNTPAAAQLPGLKDQSPFSNLLEVILANIKSPHLNHTLQRTFGPPLEAVHGPGVKMPPTKKRRVEEPQSDIPDVLQGEIARLDQRFKVNLDPSQHHGSKAIHLVCQLDDKKLPCVPPIIITVPEDYPDSSPICDISEQEYESTQFLQTVMQALSARLSKLPQTFSVSQLLDTWEMSVRQACAPKQTTFIDELTVALGL